MAEQGTVYDLKGLDQHFRSLFSRHTCNELQADSKPFCLNFCKVVEHYASCWKTPLPQLRILERALCCFTQASAFLSVGCEHVLHTLSSLALSIFELLLFFDQKDFTQDPLQKIIVTFQECCSSLARFQNVHLLQVEQLLRAGGTWVSQTLQAILSESTLPQTEVEACISSEPPVFLELRVRYLLSCQRLPEAQALAKCCAQHPTVGQHMFFFQVYLTGLCKMAQYERLREEVADFSGKDAVNFICSLETEENDDLLLGFSRVFLSQQLHRGDMHFLCDLVCLWGRLHSRLKTSKEALLKECEQLILCATNVNAIFPFIRAIMQELSEDGVQFCIEVCAHALRSCPSCDVTTKSLIYKTMASLVPNDLEICRACALLVFFLERSVEAYKMVYILYMHPDQEYHVECCPIGNRVRFETLQTLKKDLYFDPEFWNLIALRTNCLKLINEKVLSAALEEIMEEKWVPSYYLKAKSLSRGSKFTKKNGMNKEKTLKADQQNHKDPADKPPARKVGRPRLNKHLPLKKGNRGSRQWRDVSSDPTRRSTLWHLDRMHYNNALESRENRRTTRLSEKTPAKRMIRTPKWLLEDSGTLEKNAPVKGKKQYPNFPYLPLRRRRVVVRGNTKDKAKCEEKLKVNQSDDKKQENKLPSDSQTASSAPQVILELSLPDNELLGTFADEPCNRHRGLPQRLFYKQTLKVPSATKPDDINLQNEVILKAQDLTSFILMLHCYGKKPKRKRIETNSQESSSTLTCSSAQVDNSNKDQVDDKPAVEMKVTISSQTDHKTDEIASSSTDDIHEKVTLTSDADAVIKPKETQPALLSEANVECEAELKVTVDTQEERHSPKLEKAENVEHTEHILKPVPQKALSGEIASQAVGSLSPNPIIEESKPQETVVASKDALVNGTPSQEEDLTSADNSQEPFNKPNEEEPIAKAEAVDVQTSLDNLNSLSTVDTEGEISSAAAEEKDKSSIAVETKGETEELQSQDEKKDSAIFSNDPVVVDIGKTDSKSLVSSPTSNAALEDDGFDSTEPQPECEESKLEYCCCFCHKDFKGRHLIAHSMFHYRKDQCMFCGVMFKNNVKAMMHLSNHLEKLKKLQNPMTDNSPTQSRAKAKPKTSVKIKIVSKKLKLRGKETKPNSTLRKLRSGYKFRDRNKLQEGHVKPTGSKDFMHKVNGHIGKKKKKDTGNIGNNLITPTRLRNRSNENHRNCEIEPVKIEKEKPVVISSEPKHEIKVAPKTSSKQMGSNKNISQEKSSCPVDGCSWFAVNKPAAFLYHVLENHYPNTKSLELAFSMANNSCSICKRVLYSFEHFQHHVVRHRLVPRHPCPHKGCTARFKTTIDMRRHARKHSPLQAVCCLPGCPKLFICQWALILHEKDHFSKRSRAVQFDDKPKIQAILRPEKQEDPIIKKCIKSKEKVSSTTSSKSLRDAKVHSVLKKDLHTRSDVTRSQKRQENKNQSKEVPQKKMSSVVKLKYKLRHSLMRHSLQREENKTKSSQGGKVLPPRQAKISQNSSCVKNMTLGKEPKQAKSSEIKKLKGWMKSTDVVKTALTEKVGNRSQRVVSHGTSKKAASKVLSSSKNNSTISDRSKSVRRSLRRVAPVDDSPVLDESMRLATPDTTNVSEIVRNKKRLKNKKLNEREPVPTPNIAEKIIGRNKSCKRPNKSKVVFENVATQNDTFVPSPHSDSSGNSEKVEMIATSPVTKKLSREKTEAGKDKTEEFTDPAEKNSVNLPKFEKQILINETGTEDSYMVALSKSPCRATMFTALEQNVASPHNADKNVTFDHVFESTVTTVVQNPDCKANLEHSVEMADVPTLAEAISDGENTLQVEKVCLAAEDISIFDKMESTDLTDNANTSLLEEIQSKEVENIISEEKVLTDNMAHSVNATAQPAVVQKPFRPKFCSKSDILSALKTLVKSKNDKDKSPTEVKKTAVKRKNDVIRTSACKRLKFEMQAQEDVATSAETCSAKCTKKATETTDSSITNNCAPVPTLLNEKTLKETVNKGRKERNQAKLLNKKEKPIAVNAKLKKLRTANKIAVEKSTKKKRQEKSEPRGAKPKSKRSKTEKKASTKPRTPYSEETLAGSNEENCQSMPSNDSLQTNDEQDHKTKEVNINEEMHEASTTAADESTKKPKQKKSEAHGAKPKSKFPKTEKKASTKPKTPRPEVTTPGSNEGNCQSMPSNDSFQSNNEQDHKIKDVNEKKHKASKIAVDKSTKKPKQKKSEPQGAKPKSKCPKTEKKASTKPKTPRPEETIAGSNEGNCQSMPCSDSFQTNDEQDHDLRDVDINEEIHEDKEMQNSSFQTMNERRKNVRLKKQKDVFALVPEDEESPLTAFEKALSEYKKRPYMRLPATAYLEEKFTVMPKRRKDMSMFFGASRKIQTSPEQRQRCANCFSTFSSEEQLQWHLQQKCSNLFGFDSDEEGTS